MIIGVIGLPNEVDVSALTERYSLNPARQTHLKNLTRPRKSTALLFSPSAEWGDLKEKQYRRIRECLYQSRKIGLDIIYFEPDYYGTSRLLLRCTSALYSHSGKRLREIVNTVVRAGFI